MKPDKEIADLLTAFFREERKERFGGYLPTYITWKDGEKMDRDGLPLLLCALANYKQTYHPSVVTPHIAFRDLLKQVFEYVDDSSTSHWKRAMEKTSSSVCAYCKAAGDFLSTDEPNSKTTPETRFFACAVKLYTKQNVHREVNRSLRWQGQDGNYKPAASDLAWGPYILLLDTLLFYWNELNPVSTTTYRAMTLTDSDLQMYAVGNKFVWLNFVSSSKSKSRVKEFGLTVFEISNDTSDAKLWRPRDLNHPKFQLSEYPLEEEALYPAGAEFLVTAVDKSNGIIKLKLINPLGH